MKGKGQVSWKYILTGNHFNIRSISFGHFYNSQSNEYQILKYLSSYIFLVLVNLKIYKPELAHVGTDMKEGEFAGFFHWIFVHDINY